MPAVPAAVRHERAGRLRAAASANAARFHQAQLGREVRVVVERGGKGHSEHFAPVRLHGGAPVGSLIAARVTAADASGLEAG
jgi:threonylcarbamoyladenosine tRNA methylthiotransferase MtaB